MELKDLLKVLRQGKTLYLGVIVSCIFVAWIGQASQPVSYQAALLINIGRAGVSQTGDYTYDSFYRLQADERFADTVVRWFSMPRVVEDIYREAQISEGDMSLGGLAGVFSAGRLSSQVISVRYSGQNRKTMEELARAAVVVLNRYTETLNTEEREKSWFVILGSDPVIRDGRYGLLLALGGALAVGVFAGFWVVLFRHYYRKE